MIGATVNVAGNWGDDFAKRVNRQVKVAVDVSIEDGAKVASSHAAARHRTGKMEKMKIIPAVGTPEGWIGAFKSEAWYAGFQDRGTKGSHHGKYSPATLARQSSPSGRARLEKAGTGKGITPLLFLEAGRAEARKKLIERLNRL